MKRPSKLSEIFREHAINVSEEKNQTLLTAALIYLNETWRSVPRVMYNMKSFFSLKHLSTLRQRGFFYVGMGLSVD